MGLYYTIAFYQERIMMVTNSHIISAGRFGLFVIIILLHIATLAINYVNGTRIAEFPRTIQNIDRQISILFHHTWNYQKEHLANIVFIVIRFAEWFVIIRVLQYTIDPFGTAKLIDGLIMTTAFNWVNIGYQVNAVSWLIILSTIRKRFSVLNHHLRMTLLDDSIPHKDPHQLHRLTLKLGILHSQLCDTVDCFNHCHSTTMMFSLAPAFGFTVFSWFGLIHAYAARVDELVLHSWTTVTLSFNYISFVFYVVLFSAKVNDQIKQTAIVVHKAIGYRTYDKEESRQLKKFSQQLWHHSPSIVCELFAFDWELVYTMIGSLSTYLVILMQFDLVNYSNYNTTTKH
ncbi:uncharacterized protein LOC109411358 [Aedes albopictus]|uniref:Gustatory receptor n=1 Tax=Aedes albopictus TaxID=7160 RepID=A0ABM1YFB7_AEDAL|nr:uncharacterized protein LOC109411358 [Aedes albopictus]